MFKNVFTKTLFSLRWSLLGWTLGVAAVAGLTMALFNSFNQTGIDNIVNSIPKGLQSLVGNVSDFVTIPGYIGQQIFGPNLYIVTIIMSIMLFIAVSAREEENGMLRSLLGMPVSRTQIYFHKLCAALVVIAVATLSVVLALWITLEALDKSADFSRIWLSTLDLFVLNAAYGLVAYAFAMATGKKALTTLIASVYAAGSLLISTLAPAVDKLKTIDKISLIHYYNSPQIMSHGLDLKRLAILIACCLILIVIGWVGFGRRDVYTD